MRIDWGRPGAPGVSGFAAVILVALLTALPAVADGPGALTAVRTDDTLRLDGKLDEPAWSTAPAFSGFVESFPNSGAAGSPRTEARVLYDHEFLYVGITCFDPEPAKIVRQLGRRDSAPASDRVEIAIDSANDGRTAYDFVVNAAGVLRDQLLFSDVNATDSWDAVWDASVAQRADGWSAELAIPFRVLRFSAAKSQTWGMVIRRYVPRTHQVLDSTLIPRNANQITAGALAVSRFGRLQGLDQLEPAGGVEVAPYAGARGSWRPQYSDPSRPTPRLLDPTLELGVDFKIALNSNLTLTGAINPDFGQVDADQVIQNLANSEPFFPEKRPFFLQGLDIFQAVGSEYFSPQQIFYSRRIGLDAPILGAAKVTGTLAPGLEVGLLETMVMGAGNGALVPIGYSDPDSATLEPYEARPDRRYHFHLTQPLRFGPEDALPLSHPVSTNYFAAVARQRLFSSSSVGAIFTAATPLEPRCRSAEFPSAEEYLNARCFSRGGNVLGVDWNLRDAPGVWGFFGQLESSQQVGGDPDGRVLRDGTVMRPGDLGLGGHLRAGKLGGEPFRFDVTYVYEDAKLDLNQMGYQPLSNIQWTDLNLHYVRPSGWGPFRNVNVDYNLDLNWTTDGKHLPRGVNTNLYAGVQLPSYDTVGVKVALEVPQFETREIPGAGVPFERLGSYAGGLIFNSDQNRRFFASGDFFLVHSVPTAAVPAFSQLGWDLSAGWRPQDRLETRIDASFGHKPQGPRWVDTLADDTAVFGLQNPTFFSVTLRQQVVLSPKLTAQVYAQLFSNAIRYDAFYGVGLGGEEHVSYRDLLPLDYGSNPNFHQSVLNLNAVLRWEYRLGSTLYLVYTRSQSELPTPVGEAVSTSVLPSRLFSGPVAESVLLKWSYWWDV